MPINEGPILAPAKYLIKLSGYLKVPDMGVNIISYFFKTHSDFDTKRLVIFVWLLWWNLVWIFQILWPLGEINGNVAWKLENVRGGHHTK